MTCNIFPARGNITPTMTPSMPPRKKLPIGIQTFAKIRQGEAAVGSGSESGEVGGSHHVMAKLHKARHIAVALFHF